MITIVDDLVSVDTLIEDYLTVEPINEYVQSVDIVAFNKICKYCLIQKYAPFSLWNVLYLGHNYSCMSSSNYMLATGVLIEYFKIVC